MAVLSPNIKAAGDRRIMVCLADSPLLNAVFKKGLQLAHHGDTIVLLTLGDELAKRDGHSGHLTPEQIEEKLKKDFGPTVTANGQSFEVVGHEASKKVQEVIAKIVEKKKITDLVVGYNKSRKFGGSIAADCVASCACDVTVVKLEDRKV
eukprot:TRINITY_DN23143_c0_g1_i1.p1 TRINITY_DN23143_c0_g1~~TRINITY_DN23143_c0_g1_i1.p1  ORF type:complete len:150 (-),score=39.40 TRINITY_DN23143_c0_g1_i1:63-512(-)